MATDGSEGDFEGIPVPRSCASPEVRTDALGGECGGGVGRNAAAYLAAIVESADDAIISKNTSGVITSWNSAAERLFGYKAGEIVGKSVMTIIPSGRVDEEKMILGRIREGNRVDHYETTRLRKDGTPVAVSLTVSPVRNGFGRIIGASKIVRDISERLLTEENLRKRERELQRLNETLEMRVAERTAELQEKTNKLRAMASELASAEHRERKRLAARLHDDLQQLLVAASMQINVVRHQALDGEGREAVDQTARWITEAAEAARDLTRQLRPPILYEGGLVPALQWLAGEMNTRHGLKTNIQKQSRIPTLSDDMRALLFDCIRELLFNVTKHAATHHALLTLEGGAGFVKVTVSDEGSGFDAERAASEDNGRFGLFSIRERVEALAGGMKITSAPDKGTKIELSLPVHVMLASAGPARQQEVLMKAIDLQASPSLDDRTRVLVVDDHAIVRQGIANIINADERLTVVGEASTGLEALDAVDRNRPHVVLMDLNMPRMNGIEATHRIRQSWPHVVVIGLSVQDDDATANTMIEAGAAGFLSKAGSTELMIATILSLSKSPGDLSAC